MSGTYVGEAVHYRSRGSADGVFPSRCRAAMVTELCQDCPEGDPETGTECVSLMVANPEGLFFSQHVVEDFFLKPGSWHRIGPACIEANI